MQSFSHGGPPPLLMAVAVAVPALAGCACDDAGWKAVVAVNAEAAPLEAAPNCDFGDLDRLSETSAALAGRADPKLLEIARLEAERDCYKAAEEKARRLLAGSGRA